MKHVAFKRSQGSLHLLNRIGEVSRKLVILLSFALPILILYLLDPSSFELVWKGRAPYLIFLWLLFLELAMVWKKLTDKSLSISAIIITAIAPTCLVGVFAFALNNEIMELGKLVGIPYQEYGEWILEGWSLSIEYIALTICLVACVLLLYKIDSLKFFSISIFFLGATSCFYLIDTFYPFGLLNTLQGFVPVIASLVVGILNLIGYKAELLPPSSQSLGMSILKVHGIPQPIGIAWGCAGVQSLFIYTFVILLLIKGGSISLKRKIIYITIGAIGTFLVNLLRIVSICVVGVHMGPEALRMFHEYYGELFFIVWIIAYLLIITYSGRILAKMSAITSKLKKPIDLLQKHKPLINSRTMFISRYASYQSREQSPR